MEAVAAAGALESASRAAAAARLTVQGSLALAVAVGCWLMYLADPGAALAAGIAFVSAALVARWRFALATATVLVFAYTSTGLLVGLGASSYAPVWLAALAGIVTSFSWTRWQAPVRWQWPLMLWLLGVALSWPIIAAREADFVMPTVGDAVAIVVFNAVAALCAALWVDAALAWDRHIIERLLARPLLASAVVSAAAALYQGVIDIRWMSDDPWVSGQRAIGLMADANPMAIAAAVWAPLAVLVLGRARARLTALPLSMALWYAAWLTGARTVLLLIPTGAIGLAAGYIQERGVRSRTLVIALAMVAAVAGSAIVLAVSMTTPSSGPIARLARSLPLDRPSAVAYEALWRRDGYGLAAVRAIREHPLSGVGSGAFTSLSRHYYRLEGGGAVPADNAQNLWRQALAERGLLAFPAVLLLTLLTLQLLWRPASGVSSTYSASLKATIVGLGLTLTFGLPIQDPAIALTAACLVAWLHAIVPGREASPRVPHAAVVLVWVLAVAGAVVDLWGARGDLRPPFRAARLGEAYVRGVGDIHVGPRDARGRVVSRHAVVALNPAGPRYSLRFWTIGDEPRQVRVSLNGRLAVDEAIPAGLVIERLLDVPPGTQGIVLELETEPPGIAITGDFVP